MLKVINILLLLLILFFLLMMEVVLLMMFLLKKELLLLLLLLVWRYHEKDLLLLVFLVQRDHVLLMVIMLVKTFCKLENQAKHLVMVMISRMNILILNFLSIINTWKLFMVINHLRFSMLTCILGTFLIICIIV
jgi:hypothetical protein